MKIALLLLALLCLAGCTSSQSSRSLLQEQGYTHIQITGWRPLNCGHDDIWATGFRALTPAGHPISGVVCEGILKGRTIRFN